MLERRTGSNGVIFYASPLLERLGVPHAFSTRIGGVSEGPFRSLNLGNPSGCAVQDDSAHVRENYRRLQAACGCGGRELCYVHQVHGAGVVRAEEGRGVDTSAKADALVGSDRAKTLSVRVADCVPVLVAMEGGRTVAAIHAGWRGVVGGVVEAALAAVGSADCTRTCVAAIGPCIGPDAFEVGPEVVGIFLGYFRGNAPIVRRVGEKGHVDLREAVRLQLVRAGVPPDRIDTTDRCTHRDAQEFFSHRRDNGVTGRMAAVISPAA
jgi:YfiH family protein